MYVRFGKRALDLSVVLLGGLVLLPVYGVLGVMVWLRLGSPVLFRQLRPGREGIPFMLFKFRTMTDQCDEAGNLLPDAQRLTPFGRFLRSTSLDELPELLNVLRGEMSIVGPRPLLMHYLPLYSREQMRRHETRPGITGWAQINGRNAISWPERFALDLWYIEHTSLWLDSKIIWLTIWKIIKREGISQDGQATVEYFTGNVEP